MRRLTRMLVKSANAVDTRATPETINTMAHAISHGLWWEKL